MSSDKILGINPDKIFSKYKYEVEQYCKKGWEENGYSVHIYICKKCGYKYEYLEYWQIYLKKLSSRDLLMDLDFHTRHCKI